MLRTLLLFLLCLLLPVPQGALAASSGKTPVQAETSLPLNRTTFHFFSPEDIAANYKASKIIRVGYFDQHGVFEGEGEHLSGYAVALLTAISRYTGWEYKWVKIRFDELAQRLDDGTIDLSCGISFTPERSRLYSFSKLRAGYENTCLHVSSMSDMHYMDLEAFNGMRIGFFPDSLQYDVMKRFAAQNGFSFESFFFEESNEMSQALAEGRIDGYVDGVLQGKGTKVVATISTDPFFFVTRKDDSAIMDPLNEAMRQILLNYPTYLARLYDSYLNISSDVPVVFTRSECRWQGPDGKMVYPDEFIPLFEQNGFIRELDLFVLDTVCAWIRRRLDEGKKVPPISINQSKALFFHDNYVETVLGIAARHDVPAHLLHVEVTESMAWLDEEAFIRTLDALRRAGIGLSLDDFGKGYSSMAMLHSFGFDTIKLDRAFLAPGQDKQRSVWIIISSLVDMARRLGIEILCEGVETEDQLQKLLASHCKYGQGYLFSPPMDLETFDAYVDAHELERK